MIALNAIEQRRDAVGCRLCDCDARLLKSHILPKFVYRDLLKDSVTGHMRFSGEPNRRAQDGETRRWLCEACEARFSAWERDFCNEIMHPANRDETRLTYSSSLLKFCVSVSWRVLLYCKGRNPNSHYSLEQEGAIEAAEKAWRAFLLDQRPHPGQFPQQFVAHTLLGPHDALGLPQNINRYLQGAISLDIVGGTNSLYTWAKLRRFEIFGEIIPGLPFENMKVHVRHGVIEPERLQLPHLLRSLYTEKAERVRAAMASMSEAQQDKIDLAVMANADRLQTSRHIIAMLADAKIFGEAAITRPTSQ